ncbi:SMR family transporter [soil metagenome]
MGYIFLAIAIIGEIIATSFLKLTSGERNYWWAYPIVAIGYVAAFLMLWLALKQNVPLGIAYAIWAGVGVVLVAVISWVIFRETLTWMQLAGMVLVIAGVSLLELGAKH